MNQSERYNRYALCREMLETPAVIRRLDTAEIEKIRLESDRVLLSGEGSSRIFPAKRLVAQALRGGWPVRVYTEAALQAMEYSLRGYHVFVTSNSGRTAEGVGLIRHLRSEDSKDERSGAPAAITGIAAHDDTPIVRESDSRIVLQCGPEDAVAATKSVMEQALVYDLLFRNILGFPPPERSSLADLMGEVLRSDLPESLVTPVVKAPLVYFAGRNDGVAEELTLKTNEITRKRADFLEGTYAVHGVEEVMRADETVVLVDPYPSQEEKFRQVLCDGVGMKVIAIAPRDTIFPTIRVPDAGELTPYLLLAAGWNLLVEVGLAAGIDLDKPQRARKVGNELTE